MRTLLLFSALTSFAIAQDTVPNQQQAVSSGHSVFNLPQEITIAIRFVSVANHKIVTANLLPQTVLRDRQLTLPAVHGEDAKSESGIRLVSSETVVERPAPVYLSVLSEKQVSQLLEQTFADARSNVLLAPLMKLREGETSEVSDATSQRFVVGFQERGAQLTPQIDTIESGTRLIVRPQIKENGTIRLSVGARFSKISSVTQATDESTGKTIEVPEVHSSVIKLTADVAPGHTLVFGGLERSRGGRPEGNGFSWIPGMKRSGSPDIVKETVLLLLTPELAEAGESNSGS